MSKHTPGQWESSRSPEKDCYDIENHCGILVAEVYSEDDARLMAQSKRLLKALEGIIKYAADDTVECRGDKCREPWCISCCGEEDAEIAAKQARDCIAMARAAIEATKGNDND